MIQHLLERLRRFAAPWGFATELSVIATSLVTFVVIGEPLGPEQFGSLAAVLATIALVGPLLTASPEHVIVQRIAQGVPPSQAWAKSLAMLWFVGPVVAVLMVIASLVVAPNLPVWVALLFALSEVSLLGHVRVAMLAHEATGASQRATSVALGMLVCRLLVLGVFSLLEGSSVELWGVLHLVGSLPAAGFAHRTMRDAQNHVSVSPPVSDDFRRGVPFAVNAGPDQLLSNNDKIVLSSSGFGFDAGIYAAAYRVAAIANVPARAVLRTRYSSHFKPENQSRGASLANVRGIIKSTVPAGLLASVGLVVCAPIATLILGDDFAESIDALRLLAFLPIVRALSTPAADVLTGTGRQRLRIAGTLASALLNLVLNLIFIPRFGWPAAVVTTLAAEVMLVLWMWFHVLRRAPAAEEAYV